MHTVLAFIIGLVVGTALVYVILAAVTVTFTLVEG